MNTDKLAMDLINTLKSCTPEKLDKYELMIKAVIKDESDNLKRFMQLAFKIVKEEQPKMIETSRR